MKLGLISPPRPESSCPAYSRFESGDSNMSRLVLFLPEAISWSWCVKSTRHAESSSLWLSNIQAKAHEEDLMNFRGKVFPCVNVECSWMKKDQRLVVSTWVYNTIAFDQKKITKRPVADAKGQDRRGIHNIYYRQKKSPDGCPDLCPWEISKAFFFGG
jgi:hypothetical protein